MGSWLDIILSDPSRLRTVEWNETGFLKADLAELRSIHAIFSSDCTKNNTTTAEKEQRIFSFFVLIERYKSIINNGVSVTVARH